MKTIVETFLPPGVQIKLWDKRGVVPHMLPIDAHNKIMALWNRRNTCDESEIEAIDIEMESIAIAHLYL